MWVELPLRVPPGREQLGRRPAVVVGVPEEIQPIPYQVLVVVPLTRTVLRGPLFPLLKAGTGGLPADSTALVYQVAALDASRVVGKLNKLSMDEFRPIREGLRLMLKT